MTTSKSRMTLDDFIFWACICFCMGALTCKVANF
jgi:hypothetical protein